MNKKEIIYWIDKRIEKVDADKVDPSFRSGQIDAYYDVRIKLLEALNELGEEKMMTGHFLQDTNEKIDYTKGKTTSSNESEEECKHKWQGGYFVSGQLKKDLISILRDQGTRFEVKGDYVLIKSQPHEPEDKLERIMMSYPTNGYSSDEIAILAGKIVEIANTVNKINKV